MEFQDADDLHSQVGRSFVELVLRTFARYGNVHSKGLDSLSMTNIY